jgi:ATPase family associated with various cellular activities (AAA)
MTTVALRLEAVAARIALAVAERDQLEAVLPALRKRRDAAVAAVDVDDHGPLSRVVSRAALDRDACDFLWAAIGVALDPTIALHAAALAGPLARRGLSVELFAQFTPIAADAARSLGAWLARDNPLVAAGILIVDGESSAATRVYLAPARVLAHVLGDATPEAPLRAVPAVARAELELDDAQDTTLTYLARVFTHGSVIAIVEGPRSSGRTTAIAAACGRALVVLDLELASTGLERALLALRRELALEDAVPVLANPERLAPEQRGTIASFASDWRGELVIESTGTTLELPTLAPIVRVRWTVADGAVRRRFWQRSAGELSAADLDLLATRFTIGPGTIARAVDSALIAVEGPLDATALTDGLRHNLVEALGSLAQRVEVTQDWSDLVLAPDSLDQVNALIARVRCAHQVLDHWGFRDKLARGAGVPALFSGLPGTGKTMVAGLIARELGLDLYQVDLSQIVSKWVGETEKQLSRVFDAAEQGHGLLLFDEADALFAQRTADVRGAVDRYANMEVNYLLQRVESFGGLTILTTNFDQGIDRALKRRLVAHIVFELPDEDERAALWRRLASTERAPMAADIDFDRLARDFPKMSGANIRNAAVAAAFLAASDGTNVISHATLLRAARIEYRSMGFVLAT